METVKQVLQDLNVSFEATEGEHHLTIATSRPLTPDERQRIERAAAYHGGPCTFDFIEKDESAALQLQRSINAVQKLQRQIETMVEAERFLLRRIIGYCGHPDAAEGCRLILSEIRSYENGR